MLTYITLDLYTLFLIGSIVAADIAGVLLFWNK